MLSGKIDVCKFVKLACKRHMDDLLKSQTDKDYPYYYDADAGEEICSFTEKFEHIKGEKFGTRIVLEPWQCFLNAIPFGWKRRADGLRRFRGIYEEIPRKNGKSLIAAARGLFMLTLDLEPGAEVYCGATTEKQANEVFKPAKMMAKRSKEFMKAFKVQVFAESIVIKDTASSFTRLIGNPGDGGNPHFAILDEKHEQKNDDQKETMVTGMGARRQPLINEITTAGTDISVPCYLQRKYAESVLQGEIVDDQFWTVIYTIDEDDDWTRFETWIKANPNFGISVMPDFLKMQYRDALTRPELQNKNKCKHLNLWSTASAGWLNMAKWRKNKTALTLEDFKGCRCWVGFDLASKIDLASMAILFFREGKYYLFAKNYMPIDTINMPENKRFKAWHDRGQLFSTPGARTDFNQMEDDLIALSKEYKIEGIGYDPREATSFINSVQEWFGGDIVEIGQRNIYINEPMKEFEALVVAEQLYTNENDHILDWCAGNVVKKSATSKYYYPAKERIELKIDPIVAGIMALKVCMAHEDKTPNLTVMKI